MCYNILRERLSNGYAILRLLYSRGKNVIVTQTTTTTTTTTAAATTTTIITLRYSIIATIASICVCGEQRNSLCAIVQQGKIPIYKLDKRNINGKHKKKLPTDHRHQFILRNTDFYMYTNPDFENKQKKKAKVEHHFGSIATVRNTTKEKYQKKENKEEDTENRMPRFSRDSERRAATPATTPALLEDFTRRFL